MNPSQLGWEMDLQSRARARMTDPPESHIAAASVRNITETHRHILDILKEHGPLTDQDIAAIYFGRQLPWISPSGLRTRRKELVEEGRVVDSGARRKLLTGRSAIVWEAV